MDSSRGAETREGYITPNNLAASPLIIWLRSSSASPLQEFDSGVHPSAGLHLNSRKKKCSVLGEAPFFFFFGLRLILGKKSVPFLVKTFFFGLHLNFLTWNLICSPEKIVVEVHPPQCRKSGKIGVKLQIISPNAQQRFAPLDCSYIIVFPRQNNWTSKCH